MLRSYDPFWRQSPDDDVAQKQSFNAVRRVYKERKCTLQPLQSPSEKESAWIFAKNVTPVVLFPPARHPILFVWWFEWAIARALKRFQPDIFVSTDGYLTLNTDIKTLLVVHDIAFVHFPEYVAKAASLHYQYFTPKYLQKAAQIATVSEYSKEDIIKEYGTEADKIQVVYNGCDDGFKPVSDIQKKAIQAKYSQDCPYFLYLGSIHPRKNVARLIRAFTTFKMKTANNFKLLIAGRMAWQVEEVKAARIALVNEAKVLEDSIQTRFKKYISEVKNELEETYKLLDYDFIAGNSDVINQHIKKTGVASTKLNRFIQSSKRIIKQKTQQTLSFVDKQRDEYLLTEYKTKNRNNRTGSNQNSVFIINFSFDTCNSFFC